VILSGSKDYVLYELDLLHSLAEHSFPSPGPIQNRDGSYLGEHKGKPYALFKFMEGAHDQGDDHFVETAKAIGKLHLISDGLRPANSQYRVAYDQDACLSAAEDAARKMADDAGIESRLRWLKSELGALRLGDDIPKGACHGDPNPTNFLYSAGRVSAVLDFDQSSFTYLIYDVAALIYWWTWPDRGVIDFERSKTMRDAYQSVRPLSEVERLHLFDVLKLVVLMGYAWFISNDDGVDNSRRKVELLNTIGRDEFYRMLFGQSSNPIAPLLNPNKNEAL
jgi:homoserine kinase type II